MLELGGFYACIYIQLELHSTGAVKSKGRTQTAGRKGLRAVRAGLRRIWALRACRVGRVGRVGRVPGVCRTFICTNTLSTRASVPVRYLVDALLT